MGTPNTHDVCANCGEVVIQYNNTGAWQHYPPHPLNASPTNCIAPHVLAKDKVTPSLPATNKTAVRKSG